MKQLYMSAKLYFNTCEYNCPVVIFNKVITFDTVFDKRRFLIKSYVSNMILFIFIYDFIRNLI